MMRLFLDVLQTPFRNREYIVRSRYITMLFFLLSLSSCLDTLDSPSSAAGAEIQAGFLQRDSKDRDSFEFVSADTFYFSRTDTLIFSWKSEPGSFKSQLNAPTWTITIDTVNTDTVEADTVFWVQPPSGLHSLRFSIEDTEGFAKEIVLYIQINSAPVINDASLFPVLQHTRENSGITSFSWNVSDPDGDSITSCFTIGRDSLFENILSETCTRNMSAVPHSTLENDTTYWWRVIASDPVGASDTAITYLSLAANEYQHSQLFVSLDIPSTLQDERINCWLLDSSNSVVASWSGFLSDSINFDIRASGKYRIFAGLDDYPGVFGSTEEFLLFIRQGHNAGVIELRDRRAPLIFLKPPPDSTKVQSHFTFSLYEEEPGMDSTELASSFSIKARTGSGSAVSYTPESFWMNSDTLNVTLVLDEIPLNDSVEFFLSVTDTSGNSRTLESVRHYEHPRILSFCSLDDEENSLSLWMQPLFPPQEGFSCGWQNSATGAKTSVSCGDTIQIAIDTDIELIPVLTSQVNLAFAAYNFRGSPCTVVGGLLQ